MLNFFIEPYEDEVFYSILAKYNRYSGNLSSRKTEEELFGRRTSNQKSNFPSYLDCFSNQLNNSTYTADYFINNHTIFNMYTPFLPQNRRLKILEDMKGNKAVSIHMRIGEMAGGICKSFGIRVCLSCIDEDKERYGESYIHRSHQALGNQICSKHSEILKKIILPPHLGKAELVDLKKCEIEMNNCVVNNNNVIDFQNFSIDISKLFESTCDKTNLKITIQKYRVMLKKKGFSSISGIIDWTRVEKELLDFYSVDFLNQLESNLDENDNYKWTRQLLNEKKLVHPIRHLLFIRFLFGDVNNFMMFNELEYRPFGKGPWPCLNPVASHYKKEVIENVELSRRSKSTNPLGIFRCSCGYSYTRLGPDKEHEDKYKKRSVKSYGEIWLNELNNCIRKQVYNISELERIMGCDSKTIGKYAKELEIFDLLNSKMKIESKRSSNTPKYDKSLEETYKSDVIQFITDNPNAIRKEIEQTLSKQCTWLRRYRRDWLDSTFPEPLKKFTDKRRRKSYVDWEDRDNDLSMNIQQVIYDISDNTNRKVTMGLLCSILKFPLYKHLDKLPKTKNILKYNMIITT